MNFNEDKIVYIPVFNGEYVTHNHCGTYLVKELKVAEYYNSLEELIENIDYYIQEEVLPDIEYEILTYKHILQLTQI